MCSTAARTATSIFSGRVPLYISLTFFFFNKLQWSWRIDLRLDIQNKSNGVEAFSADLLVHGAVIAPPTLCHSNDKIIM